MLENTFKYICSYFIIKIKFILLSFNFQIKYFVKKKKALTMAFINKKVKKYHKYLSFITNNEYYSS